MKAAIVTAVALGLGVVGAKKIVTAAAENRPPAASSANAQAPSRSQSACWSDGKIKKNRFSLRGEEGAIRSFELERTSGCEFRAKITYTSANGSEKTLDYDAKYIRGTSPIFVRYNTPP